MKRSNGIICAITVTGKVTPRAIAKHRTDPPADIVEKREYWQTPVGAETKAKLNICMVDVEKWDTRRTRCVKRTKDCSYPQAQR